MSMSNATRASEPPARRGVVLRDPLPWPELRQIVQTIEDTGYEAVFVPEISAREAFSTLTGLALTTRCLLLGTGVVTVGSRSPATTAMAAASIHELSSGRMILGIGSGTLPPDRRPGGGSILAVVRDYVTVVREILSGRMVGPGDRFGAAGFELQLPVPTGPSPIWLGAIGDRMIGLAGEVADGVLLNWCTPQRVAEAVRLVAQGAERAGRPSGDVTIAVYLRACLGVERTVALEALRPIVGQYAGIPHYGRQFAAMGFGEEASAAARAFTEGHPREVPEAMVRAFALTGGRAEAVARIDAFHAAGADLVLCYPVPALEPFSSILGTILAVAPSPSVER